MAALAYSCANCPKTLETKFTHPIASTQGVPLLPVSPEVVYCLSGTLPTPAESRNDVSRTKFASVSLPGPVDGLLEGEEKERGAGEESGKEEEGTAVVSAAWAGAWQLLWGLPCMVTALLTSLTWY